VAVHGDDERCRLAVRAQPGAKRGGLLGMWQERVRVAVAAPPVDGKANVALERYFAELCELALRDVRVVAGQTHRDKTIALAAPRAVVLAALAEAWPE
jgi:uncharacterized protein (TIGR00251 family)